jgi:hypothetical protein
MVGRPPEVQAILRLWPARIAELRARRSRLEARLLKTPRNASLSWASEHLHTKPIVRSGFAF